MLVHLHRGDYVAADKCVRESYRYSLHNSDEIAEVRDVKKKTKTQDQNKNVFPPYVHVVVFLGHFYMLLLVLMLLE